MREQLQFPDPNREELERMKDFSRFCLWIILWVIIFLGSLAAIGYCKAHAEKIDNKVEMHINHLMR